MIKMRYIWEICGGLIESSKKCIQQCNITVPKLCIDILWSVEDGTERASLKLQDQQAITAFNIPSDRVDYFKQYCSKYGNFFHPANDIPNKFMHDEILKVFRHTYSFSTFTVIAIPFWKVQ